MGDWGYLILQIGITIVVIGALAALVYWFVRRYSGSGLGIGRGRVPRLAVVDALTIDRRRRLLLVRRDNVEHLIMVGGPADLIVEQAIQRTRPRQAPRPSTTTTEIPAVPEIGPGFVAPVQSAPSVHVPSSEPAMDAPPTASGGDTIERPAFPIPGPASAPAYRVDRRQSSPVDTRQLLETIGETKAAGARGAAQHEPNLQNSYPVAGLPYGRELRIISAESARPPEPAYNGASEAALTKISDLEQEMARLLGELTVKRPS